MIKSNDVVGLKLISIQEGKELGKVEDLIFDSNTQKITALQISGGLFGGKRVVLIEDVKSIGHDAVMIDSESYLYKGDQIKENISEILEKGGYLTATKIITDQGTVLGKVSEIYFDPLTGDVIEFEVEDKNLDQRKIIKVSDILSVGHDATIVKGYSLEEPSLENYDHHDNKDFYVVAHTISPKRKK